ncbi:MAG: glycoside hydrolase family 88 protein [Anaerolineae bacterium]|nr:glycoside hydrolase family 88 protein [Anaerolineae bacterium]
MTLDSRPIPGIHAIVERTLEYPFKVWGFGEGIALEAVWQAGDWLDAPECRQRVIALLDQWLARPLVEADHSAPGGLLLDAWEATGERRYLERAEALAAYLDTLPRTTAGALLHRPQHPDYHDFLYVDCMEVDAPFLCRLAQATGDVRCFDRAADQLLGYAALLQDGATHLFYHQYNGATNRVNGAFWGRGNGWALLGMLKTLRSLPAAHPSYGEIHLRFQRLVTALVAHQRPDGEWATVLDQPDTYVEGSLTAMFGYGIAEGIGSELLPPDYQASADAAWIALRRRMSPDGLLEGVSVATPPGDAAHYNAIPVGAGFPWGQGPALLAHLLRYQNPLS